MSGSERSDHFFVTSHIEGFNMDSPDVHRVLHDGHVRLALGRGVDGEFRGRDDEALAEGQPHALPQSVGEPGTHKPNSAEPVITGRRPGVRVPVAQHLALLPMEIHESAV